MTSPQLISRSRWNLGRTLKEQLLTKGIFLMTVKDTVAVHSVINDIISKLSDNCSIILLTGPTPPTQINLSMDSSKLQRTGWVTTATGELPEVHTAILSPYDPTTILMFITDVLKTVPPSSKVVIVGDFLDNLLPQIDSKQLSAFVSSLTALIKLRGYTGILIVSSESHDSSKISILKRFADIIGDIGQNELTRRWHVSVWNKFDNSSSRWSLENIPSRAPRFRAIRSSFRKIKVVRSRFVEIHRSTFRRVIADSRSSSAYLRHNLRPLFLSAGGLISKLGRAAKTGSKSSAASVKVLTQELIIVVRRISSVTTAYSKKFRSQLAKMFRRRDKD